MNASQTEKGVYKCCTSPVLKRSSVARHHEPHFPLRQTQTNRPNHLIFQVHEEERFRQKVEETNLEEATFVTDQCLEQICQETNKDASLQTLMTQMTAGWPDDKLQSVLCVREYWPYREELSTQNGPVTPGTRIIIPHSMRNEMTTRAHRSHLGIQCTINTAGDIMYWPRMTANITEAVQRCETCQQMKPALTKEPMMTYPVPICIFNAILYIELFYLCIFVCRNYSPCIIRITCITYITSRFL